MKPIKKLLTSIWFYVALLIAAPAGLWILDCLYKHSGFWETSWGVKEALAFYGSYLAFVGGVVLGSVAVFQNERAQEQAEKANQLTTQMQRLELAKSVSIVSVMLININKRKAGQDTYINPNVPDPEIISLKADNFNCVHCYHVDVVFRNESDFPIVQMVIRPGQIGDATYKLYGMRVADKALYIPPRGTLPIRFIVPSQMFEAANKYGLVLKIGFVNIFDITTPATINIVDLENHNRQHAYSYRLAKFTDVVLSEHDDSSETKKATSKSNKKDAKQSSGKETCQAKGKGSSKIV